MSDLIQKALAERYKYEISYSDPLTGIDKNGEEVTGMQTITVSVTAAINFQRAVEKRYNQLLGQRTDEQLLEEFIVVSWAEIMEKRE